MKRFMTSIAIGTLILGGLTTLGVASASAAGPTITLTPSTGCRLARSWPWPARVPGRRDPLRPRVRQRRRRHESNRLRHQHREPRPVQCHGHVLGFGHRRHGSDRRHHDVRNDVGRPFQLRDRREHQSPSADAALMPITFALTGCDYHDHDHDTSGEDRTA